MKDAHCTFCEEDYSHWFNDETVQGKAWHYVHSTGAIFEASQRQLGDVAEACVETEVFPTALEITVMCGPCYSRVASGSQPRTVADKEVHYADIDFQEQYPSGEIGNCYCCEKPINFGWDARPQMRPHPLLHNPHKEGSVGIWLCRQCHKTYKDTGNLPPRKTPAKKHPVTVLHPVPFPEMCVL